MNPETQNVISEALGVATEMNPQATDGTWLEDLTVQVGVYIKEWDIAQCYRWAEWPEREEHFPRSTKQDVGIDAVAIRRGDKQYVAIQCKARQLDEPRQRCRHREERNRQVCQRLGRWILGGTLDCNQRQQPVE